jgi:hypothetical protein
MRKASKASGSTWQGTRTGWMLATKGLTDAVVVGVDEDGLLEVVVVAGRNARTSIAERHRLRVEAMQLRDEREDEAPAHHAAPIGVGRT